MLEYNLLSLFLYSIAALSLPAVFNVILSTLFVPGVTCLKNIQYRLTCT